MSRRLFHPAEHLIDRRHPRDDFECILADMFLGYLLAQLRVAQHAVGEALLNQGEEERLLARIGMRLVFAP